MDDVSNRSLAKGILTALVLLVLLAVAIANGWGYIALVGVGIGLVFIVVAYFFAILFEGIDAMDEESR